MTDTKKMTDLRNHGKLQDIKIKKLIDRNNSLKMRISKIRKKKK